MATESTTPAEFSRPRLKRVAEAVGRDGRRVAVSELDVRRVWVAAGGRCTFCKAYLAEDAATGQMVFTGQLAHIVGATDLPNSPRGRSPKTPEQRAEAGNLLLLCPNEHKVIDTKPLWTTYDEATLLEFKTRHERDVRELTDLLPKPKTTVIRVAGDIRGAAADFSRDAVIRALLREGRLPDFGLHGGYQNCEVDLRQSEGEDVDLPVYWAIAKHTLEHRLGPLKNYLKTNEIRHVSVFALARIPLLVQLGVLLDDVTNVTVYNRRREEGWGWGSEGNTEGPTFLVTESPGVGDPLVTFAISGPIDASALPTELHGRPRYEITVGGAGPHPNVLRSSEDLRTLVDTWRGVLATIEAHHRDRPISLLLAVCAAGAVEIGRAHMRGVHAPLQIYDRVNGAYELVLVAG